MTKTVMIAALLGVAAAQPALAADLCHVPEAEWGKIEDLQAQLEQRGWQIRTMKIDDGCFEAYAIDDQGRRVEVYFDPKTFEPVKEEIES